MKIAVILLFFPALSFSKDAITPAASDKHLVEVNYFHYLSTAAMPRYIEVTVYLSEHFRGEISDDPMWARQGGAVGDDDTKRKAAECKKIIQTLVEPQKLPETPARIVTIRCADDDKWIVRRFPIDQVPTAVRQILVIMGFPDERLKHIPFAQE